MKNLIVLFCGLILISSCVTKKRCAEKFPPEITSFDSSSSTVKIIYRDTLVHDTIPGDTVIVEVEADCDPVTGKLLNKPYTTVYSDKFIDVIFGVFNNEPLVKVIRKPIYRDYLFQKIYAEKLYSHFTRNTSIVFKEVKVIPIWIWILVGALLFSNLLSFIRK